MITYQNQKERKMNRKRSSYKNIQLTNGEETIKVRIKRNARAKKLRIHVGLKGVSLIAPLSFNMNDAHKFLLTEEHWVRENLKKYRPSKACDGQVLIFGEPHAIEQCSNPSNKISVHNNKILVPYLDHKIFTPIKKYLLELLKIRIYDIADKICGSLGVKYSHISFRDPISRWGSCSSRGRISFSWRLVFAPLYVIEAVVAHELCHLLEMSHNERFWRLLDEVNPDHREAELWLRQNGNTLHQYFAFL